MNYYIKQNGEFIASVSPSTAERIFAGRRGNHIAVEFGYHRVVENVHAGRDYNLVNAQRGVIVRINGALGIDAIAVQINAVHSERTGVPEFYIID